VSECAGLSGEQIAWLNVSAEIERTLLQGFKGSITLECSGDGTVRVVRFEDYWKPDSGERRTYERRTDGPRDGEERRQKG
jgi:hypothetical protein